MTEPEIIHLDMICRCGDNAAEADALKTEVMQRLGNVTDADFLTCVVTSLNWDYGAEITGIHNDQWSMVTAETWRSHMRETAWLKVTVPCDLVEDGIAAIWKAFADRGGRDDSLGN